MLGFVALQRSLQHFNPGHRQFLLARSEGPVQRKKEVHKPGGKIAGRIEAGRRAADRVEQGFRFRGPFCSGRHIREFLDLKGFLGFWSVCIIRNIYS